MYLATTAVRNKNISIRVAAHRYHVPKSILHDNVLKAQNGRKSAKLGRKTALSIEEEKSVVYSLLFFPDCGVLLTRAHLQYALELFIEGFSEERKAALSLHEQSPECSIHTCF